MRTATDFNQFYAVEDPWQISRAAFRDRILRRAIQKAVAGKSVLELGCGEGHLTEAVFGGARAVTGVDFSDIAVKRAAARAIPNARFAKADLLEVSLTGFDVIAAIECLYYLSPEDQGVFFAKVAREHRGTLIVSGPILGGKYFTHAGLLDVFGRHGLKVLQWRNLNVYRQRGGITANVAAVLVRLPFCSWVLDWLPDRLIYQRYYLAAV